jgi:hypothetical protein
MHIRCRRRKWPPLGIAWQSQNPALRQTLAKPYNNENHAFYAPATHYLVAGRQPFGDLVSRLRE